MSDEMHVPGAAHGIVLGAPPTKPLPGYDAVVEMVRQKFDLLYAGADPSKIRIIKRLGVNGRFKYEVVEV